MAIFETVIYPKDGYVIDGVRFVVSDRMLPDAPYVWDKDILHAWWCSLTLDEVRSMHADGITFDKVIERMTVLRLN
jgi:hypothetical protein